MFRSSVEPSFSLRRYISLLVLSFSLTNHIGVFTSLSESGIEILSYPTVLSPFTFFLAKNHFSYLDVTCSSGFPGFSDSCESGTKMVNGAVCPPYSIVIYFSPLPFGVKVKVPSPFLLIVPNFPEVSFEFGLSGS